MYTGVGLCAKFQDSNGLWEDPRKRFVVLLHNSKRFLCKDLGAIESQRESLFFVCFTSHVFLIQRHNIPINFMQDVMTSSMMDLLQAGRNIDEIVIKIESFHPA